MGVEIMAEHRRYRGDPSWLTLRYAGQCKRCGAVLAAGSEAFRYKTGDLYGSACGHGQQCSAEFAAAAEDEEVYMQGYGS